MKPLIAPKPETINLSLIAHTNAGKTTLLRSWLGQSVGEVRDAAHVTQTVDAHLLIRSPEGEQLMLWDVPGFSDSELMAQRMSQGKHPLGRFVSEVWDRLHERPLWLNQRALTHVHDTSHAVLYLINASEATTDVPWIDAELKMLACANKPIILLLNQLGSPLSSEQEAAELNRWRARISQHVPGLIREVLALDAFSRCWVQHDAVLSAVTRSLPQKHRATMQRLQLAAEAKERQRWQASMQTMALTLHDLVGDQVDLKSGTSAWRNRLRQAGLGVGIKLRELSGRSPTEAAEMAPPNVLAAQGALGDVLQKRMKSFAVQLLELHQISGEFDSARRQPKPDSFLLLVPLTPGKSVIRTALLGLLLGGMGAAVTMGGRAAVGGAILGAAAGAVGAAARVRLTNRKRGISRPTLCWSDAGLRDATHSALLSYLLVAHHGPGRGPFGRQPSWPLFWADVVDRALAVQDARMSTLWMKARTARSPERTQIDVDQIAAMLSDMISTVLRELYPNTRPLT